MIANKDYVASVFMEHWLCNHPYAADDYSKGIYRTSRDKAVTRKHIQANPRNMQSMIVVDIDDPDAMAICLWDNPIRPNLIAENTANGHAHAFWFLVKPVCTSDKARLKPVLYLKAIKHNLTKYMHGDFAYSGLMCKNPMSKAWDVMVVHDHAYTLQELMQGLKEADCWKDIQLQYAAELLGRNCTLFDAVRRWAYRAVRKFRDSYDAFREAISSKVAELNACFKDKLGTSELRGIANSIANWVWKSPLRTKSDKEFADTFHRMQSARGRKGAIASLRTRKSRMEAFASDMLADKSLLDLDVHTLASKYNVSVRTIYRWLKQLNAKPAKALHKQPVPKPVKQDKPMHKQPFTSCIQPTLSHISDLDTCHKSYCSSDSFRICPECMSPVWGGGPCTCMMDDGYDDEHDIWSRPMALA